MPEPTIECLDPLLVPGTRVVVLGSMPGEVSLRERQYYAHPRNRFWPVMEALGLLNASSAYPERIRALGMAGVGLWDVLRSCERAGSLDGSIARSSEVPNDFAWLLGAYPSIRAVAFNGAKAFQIFDKRVASTLPASASIDFLRMPSTSPANASWSFPRLVAEWARIATYL